MVVPDLRQRMIQAFAAQQQPLQQQRIGLRDAQEAADVKRFLGQAATARDSELAGFLSRVSGGEQERVAAALSNLNAPGFDALDPGKQREIAAAAATPLNQAREIQAAQAVRSQLGLNVDQAAGLSSEGLQELMGGQPATGRSAIAREYAKRQAPGMLQGVNALRQRSVDALASDGIKGDVARVGLVSAITGGGVAGGAALTAGAQQLYQLIAYLQNGEANEQRAASSPLA